MERVVIIGGGVSGLSCLNALLDRGIQALLLEGAAIGTPKMCGEFLAPDAVTLLKKWNIGPIHPIKNVRFFVKNKQFDLDFPKEAGAFARRDAEIQLAARALQRGGQIREHALIKEIIPATNHLPFRLCLTSGEEIQTNTAIFATGRFGQEALSKNKPRYVAFKIHIPYVADPDTLYMHSFPGGYFGVVAISSDTSNCACLVEREFVEKAGSVKQFFYQLIKTHSQLQNVFRNIDITTLNIFEGFAPEFQQKNVPTWPRAFWIGDGLAGIHPAIGYGFAHSIRSAVMAAESCLRDNPEEYQQHSIRWIKPKLRLGKLMHKILINPLLGYLIFPIVRKNPWIVKRFFMAIHY